MMADEHVFVLEEGKGRPKRERQAPQGLYSQPIFSSALRGLL